MIKRKGAYGRVLAGAIAGLCLLALSAGVLATEDVAKDVGKFEQTLKDNFPGSYKLYMDLNSEGRSEVFKEFKKSNADEGMARFSTVIAKILRLSIDRQ